MAQRTTPEHITELQPNEIFVFGSNLEGMHGGGAAYIAYRKFGAIMGQGVGLQGQSYGIPTMQGGVETIKPYVDEFIEFAKINKHLTFLVTRIGCGIAGFTDEEREKFTTLLGSGFTDSWRFCHPDEVKYSWWSYRFRARENNAGWRIDYFVVSDRLRPLIAGTEIHNEIFGSDHCPVELDLTL